MEEITSYVDGMSLGWRRLSATLLFLLVVYGVYVVSPLVLDIMESPGPIGVGFLVFLGFVFCVPLWMAFVLAKHPVNTAA